MRKCIIYTILMALMPILAASCSLTRNEREAKVLGCSETALSKMSAEEQKSVRHLIDSLSRLGHLSDKDLSQLVLTASHGLFVNAQYRDLILYHDELGDVFDTYDTGDKEAESNIVDISMFISAAYQQLGMNDRASKGYQLIIPRLEKSNDRERLSVVYTNLSNLYKNAKDYDKSLELQHKSLKINQELQDTVGIIYNYNNIASVYMDRGNNEKAIEYRFLALHVATSPDNAPLRHAITRNLATNYMKMEEWSMARKYLEQSISYYEQSGLKSELPLTYSKYAETLSNIGHNDRAKDYFNRSVSLMDLCNPEQKQDILRTYLRFMEQTNNPSGEAGHKSEMFGRLMALTDTILNDRTEKMTSSTSELYKTELARAEQREKDAVGLVERRLWTVGVVALLFLATAVLLYIKLYRQSKRIRVLKSGQQEMKTMLANQSDAIEHNKEFLSSVGADLQALRNLLEVRNTQKSRTELRRIISTVLGEAETDIDNCVYVAETAFHQKLLAGYPNLTSRDLKLCTLIRQGYSSKEIAGIMCREVRSIDAARNRLRKNLRLTRRLTSAFSCST